MAFKVQETTVHANPNETIISGTNKMSELLPAFRLIARDIPEFQNLPTIENKVRNDPNHKWWDSDDATEMHDALIDLLNQYTPGDKFSFTTHPGDGDHWGYWEEKS